MRRFVLSLLSVSAAGCGGGDVTPPPPLREADVSVSRNGDAACAARHGRFECWGEPIADPTQFETQGSVLAVAAGDEHVCSLSERGAIECRGQYSFEGDFRTKEWSQVASSNLAQACAVSAEGQVSCWFSQEYLDWVRANVEGALKDYIVETLTSIRDQVPAGSDFVQLDVLQSLGCARRSSNELVCWGNSAANVGPAPRKLIDFGVSVGFACGLDEEHMPHCWGVREMPISGGPYASIHVGWDNVCFLDDEQRAHCFGGNRYGQRDAPDRRFLDLSVSMAICGVTVEQEIICWGKDDKGQTMVPAIGTP